MSRGSSAVGRRCWTAGLVSLAVGVVVAVSATAASAAVPQQVGLPPLLPILRSTPSDTRATFFEGNAVTCADVGFPDFDQLGAQGNNSASDGNVTGTTGPNAGTVQPGQGEEVNVALTNPGAVIAAVVVKGGNGYNVYSNLAVLPPDLPPNQHYISPLNGGGNVPDLSHWFVCYRLTTPLAVGSLTVRKTVIPPPAPPGTPLPTAYTAVVNCNDDIAAHQNVVVTFNLGGGRGAGPTISGIPVGTVCTVVEQNTSAFPPGSTVTYDPAGVDTTGVTITSSAGVLVTITNSFAGLTPLQMASVRVVKAVIPAPSGVTLPAGYTAHVMCDDGTGADVALPGTGGEGTPIVAVSAKALCALAEDTTSLPSGLVVTYAVGGGPASPNPPVFNVAANETVTVTITNDATAVSVVTTTTTASTAPTTAPTDPTTAPNVVPTGTLPPTGGHDGSTVVAGLAAMGTGAILVWLTRRRATS